MADILQLFGEFVGNGAKKVGTLGKWKKSGDFGEKLQRTMRGFR